MKSKKIQGKNFRIEPEPNHLERLGHWAGLQQRILLSRIYKEEDGLVGQNLLSKLLYDFYDYKNGIKLGWCIDDPKAPIDPNKPPLE